MACNECGGSHGEIKLDGSLGTGDTALLTLITHDDVQGDVETTFQFPYALIDMGMLNKFSLFKLILGYKIVRVPAPQKDGVL